MKLLLFTLLMMFSFSTIALEFHRCIDDKNQVHFTNLPIASLDINCLPKDRYTMMLNQDYRNLASEFEKYGADVDKENEFESVENNQSINAITPPVKDILDSDQALDELLRNSEKDDSSFKRLLKASSEAVERVLEQDIDGKPLE